MVLTTQSLLAQRLGRGTVRPQRDELHDYSVISECSDYVLTSELLVFYLVRPQNCEKRLLASSCFSVRLSILLHGTTRLTLDEFS